LPDINVSTNKYQVLDTGIICPLSIIKNIGTSICNEIIKEREKEPFKDFIDFAKRTYNKGINKKILTQLINANCFSNFEYNRKTLINNLDNIINYAELSQDIGILELATPEIEIYPEYSNEELIETQMSTFGFFLSNHPVSKFRHKDDIKTNEIKNYFNKNIKMTLMINKVKEITTKNNDIMAFITGTDEYGKISLTIFPNKYKECTKIKEYDIISISGKVEKRFDTYQVIINNLNKLE